MGYLGVFTQRTASRLRSSLSRLRERARVRVVPHRSLSVAARVRDRGSTYANVDADQHELRSDGRMNAALLALTLTLSRKRERGLDFSTARVSVNRP